MKKLFLMSVLLSLLFINGCGCKQLVKEVNVIPDKIVETVDVAIDTLQPALIKESTVTVKAISDNVVDVDVSLPDKIASIDTSIDISSKTFSDNEIIMDNDMNVIITPDTMSVFLAWAKDNPVMFFALVMLLGMIVVAVIVLKEETKKEE